jgi:lysozyme family protein
MTYRNEFINHILKVEGGYINDPSDSGGETNYGVTVRVARKFGYKNDMKDMSIYIAREIYEKLYWYSLRLDVIEEISRAIAKELGDTGVNQGVGRAGEFLQRSLNVLNNNEKLYNNITVDGDIGPNTLKTLQRYFKIRGSDGETVLYNMLNCLQGAFYVELAERRSKDKKFVYGWFKNRINIS